MCFLPDGGPRSVGVGGAGMGVGVGGGDTNLNKGISAGGWVRLGEGSES